MADRVNAAPASQPWFLISPHAQYPDSEPVLGVRVSQVFHEDQGAGQSPRRATDGKNPYHGAPPRKKDGKPDPIEQNEVSAGAHSREQAKPAGSWPRRTASRARRSTRR